MFEQITGNALAANTSVALRAHVIEQLLELSATQTNAEVCIRVSEQSVSMLEQLLDGVDLNMPVVLTSDSKLSPNQLFVSLDTVEREINLDTVCKEITTAMNAFNFHSQTERPDA